MPTRTRRAGRRSIDRSRRWSAAVPWYGNTARFRHDPEPDGVGAAAGVDHRVAQHRRARHPTPRSPRRRGTPSSERLEERRVLEHRAQVQRRAVGEVDEAGVSRRSAAMARSSASARCSTSTAPHGGAEVREVGHGPFDDPVGVLERRGRRAAPRPRWRRCASSSSASKLAAPVTPLAAADQRERARALRSWRAHGRREPDAGPVDLRRSWQQRAGNLHQLTPRGSRA